MGLYLGNERARIILDGTKYIMRFNVTDKNSDEDTINQKISSSIGEIFKDIDGMYLTVKEGDLL